MTVSARLAELVVSRRYEDLPASTVAAAKAHLLDGLGIILSGSRTPLAAFAERYLARPERGRLDPASTEWPVMFPSADRRLPLEDAAFLLGCMAFSQNYGDTSLLSVAHPNTLVVPALLLASQQGAVSGKEALVALVVGYQVLEYAAQALNNGIPRMGHQLKGFRPSSSCGALGVVATAGRLAGTSSHQLATALEIACNFGGGIRRSTGGSLSSLRVHAGQSVRDGMLSLLLTQEGLFGEPEMFEGSGGFFSAYAGGPLDARVGRYLEPTAWAVEDVAFKFHCTAHTLITALDCVLEIARQMQSDPDEVETVDIWVPDEHTRISAARPRPPVDPEEGGRLYEYCTAIVIRSRDYVWPESLEDYFEDPQIRDLLDRVRVHSDPELSRRFEEVPGSWPARARVVASGQRFEAEMDFPVGSRLDAVVGKLVEAKFHRLARGTVSDERAEAITSFVSDLENVPDFHRALMGADRWSSICKA
jgi:2-methylcitrate dehydratase PrpD